MKTTPYNYLLTRIREFCFKLRNHHGTRAVMFEIPKDALHTGYSMHEVYERTIAAESLGYEVVVRGDSSKLSFVYRKQAPEIPAGW